MWHYTDTNRRDTFWSHLVPVWISAHRVLSSQCNAARHDHEEDGHLKVAQSDHIVTDPPDAAHQHRGRCFSLVDEKFKQRAQKTNSGFVSSYGLEALKMNMLSGTTRLGGDGASSSSSSSSVSSSLWSEWYGSNSLLFTKTQAEVRERGRNCLSCTWTTVTKKEQCESPAQWNHQKKTQRVALSTDVRNTYTRWSRVILMLNPILWCTGVWLQWEVITVLPVMGVSSSSGCADISMVTLPSRLDLFRLMDTGRLSDSMDRTVNSVASKAGSTGMFWFRGSYWSGCPPPPCSDQEQSSSCSHWGGSGMLAALTRRRKDDWS